MNEPWVYRCTTDIPVYWRTTDIPCPLCKSPLLGRNQLSKMQGDYNYCCVRCGISWRWEARTWNCEHLKVILRVLLIVILMTLAYGSIAAAESICLNVITDGTSMCVDVPTYLESTRFNEVEGLPGFYLILAIFMIPFFVGATLRCRHDWSGIVSLAIAFGCGAGLILGPLFVQYRYQELYWDNPDLFAETFSKSLWFIILSMPLSIFSTWSANSQRREVKQNW